MAKKNITRRNFIKTVSAGTAGMAIGLPSVKPRRILGSNDKVRVGIVGFSDRARYSLIPAFHWHAKKLNFEIVAVSDIWNRRRQEGVKFLEELTGNKITPMRNNEELWLIQLGRLLVHVLDPDGTHHVLRLGTDLAARRRAANGYCPG